MTNAELIDGLRWCADESICCDDFSGEKCPYFDEKKDSCSVDEILHAAADALEAADKRIDGLQKLVDINTERCEALRKQLRESHESYEKRIEELEQERNKTVTAIFYEEQKWWENRCKELETERMELTTKCGRLEAQLPKEGEWINEDLDNFRKYKVTCPHCGAWYIGNYDAYDEPSDFNYCPHCGNICNPANIEWEKMQKERNGKGQADADC